MKLKIRFNRDTNYYFGLFLLILASVSIVWAFFNDGFDPEDFLVYFLIYAWGITLLLKSDTEFRLKRLEEETTRILSRLDRLEENLNPPAVESGEETPVEDESLREETATEEGTAAGGEAMESPGEF
ncbi:MAG: hypothetical protein GX050_10155 [Firmicutes bacterium]|nr:hypothetical protein [Bacillota bacterium]